MRRRDGGPWIATMVLSLFVLAAAGAGIAAAAVGLTTSTGRDGPVVMTVGAGLAPRSLPASGQTPVRLDAEAEMSDPSRHGEYTPPIGELRLESGSLEVHTQGIPVCRLGQLRAIDTEVAERVCGPALIGAGSAFGGFYFLGQGPVALRSKLLVFNGGTKGDKTTLFFHTDLTATGFLPIYSSRGPAHEVIVAKMTTENLPDGKFGTLAVAKIPPVFDRGGALLGFHLTIDRNVAGIDPISATCQRGRIRAKVEGRFRDESESEVTTSLAVPCGSAA